MKDSNVENFYKTNVIIWGAILAGMVVLVAITYFLDQTGMFQPIPETKEFKNVFFALILIVALAVLFLKRSYFDFDKIYSKIQSPTQDKKLAYLSKLRINYVIIWALSEAIIMFGFVEYILVGDFKSFLLYAIVGLYAILINYPKRSLFDTHLQQLAEKEGMSV
jgi:hypothetical protein